MTPWQAQHAWRSPQQAGQAGLLCPGRFVLHQQGSCKFPTASYLFPYFVEQTGVIQKNGQSSEWQYHSDCSDGLYPTSKERTAYNRGTGAGQAVTEEGWGKGAVWSWLGRHSDHPHRDATSRTNNLRIEYPLAMHFATSSFFVALCALRHNEAVRWTLGYYGLFMCLGLSTAVLGPTLLALAEQTQTPLGQMGWLFLVGAAGQTVGTSLSGRVFDRVPGHPVLSMAQLAVAALLVVVPLLPWFGLVVAVVVCAGVAQGLINTGANTLLIWTHGAKVGPYMNGLHFCFGLGACGAPLLVAQVIGGAGGYRWAYWTLAAVMTLVSLYLLLVSGHPRPVQHRLPGTRARDIPPGSSSRIIAAALFLFFYVGAEVAFGGWVAPYAVALQLASAVGAAYLTAGFWLAFTVGRLLAIPVATRFPPQRMVLAALSLCLSLLAVLLLLPDTRVVVWSVAVGLGFCMAPLWPMGFTLAGQSLTLTATVSGMILLGDSFGGMVLPWLVGQVMAVTGPRALAFLVFGSLVCTCVAFVVLLRLRPAMPHTGTGVEETEEQ